MEERIRVEMCADPQLLEAVRGLVRGFALSRGIDEDRVESVVLAMNEACCNSIRHSYGSDPKRRFTLRLGADADWIEFELQDAGKPAPRDRIQPGSRKRPNRQDVQPGGLGVQLIREAFDEVEFEPGRTRGNRLRMRLRRKGGETGAKHKKRDKTS